MLLVNYMYKETQVCEVFLIFSEYETCIPSISTLQLKNGKVVMMSELKIGDQVKTSKSKKKIFYLYFV